MAASVASDERTLRMVHTFDAPVERVFAAWTDPAQFVEWFGPHGMKNTHCEFDLRVGGTWRLQAEGLGTRRALSGKYLEIDPPRRLAFTWAWHETGDLSTPREHETTVALDFKPAGRCTELTLTQSLFRDRTGADNHRWGWGQTFEKLATLLSRAA
jgi:uncharacterized protein YndB with AHSA1/START domain